MSLYQKTLRSFVTAEGKLVLCNEPFFAYFGQCTQHLIGKSVNDVFSAYSADEIMRAVQCCQSNPAQSLTVDVETTCQQGSCLFRWMIYAEQWQGRVSGIHLVGEVMATA
ncbi:MAG TPA: PAS domain-containing protein [Flavisolibacter sp.]|nr:PAS domain-containing protein [Flavisolibacter sp.]